MFGFTVGVIEIGGRQTKAAQSARTPKLADWRSGKHAQRCFGFGSLVYAQACENARPSTRVNLTSSCDYTHHQFTRRRGAAKMKGGE